MSTSGLQIHVDACTHTCARICAHASPQRYSWEVNGSGVQGEHERRLLVTVPAGERDKQECSQQSREGLDRRNLGSIVATVSCAA